MNRENLKKLADYLMNGLKARFSMRDFALPDYGSTTNSRYMTDCGSVGCAVGHGPYAGIPKTTEEDWWGYSERVFGLGNARDGDKEDWNWCFDTDWTTIDNTAVGAAKRIYYLLQNGTRPAGFSDCQYHMGTCFIDYEETLGWKELYQNQQVVNADGTPC